MKGVLCIFSVLLLRSLAQDESGWRESSPIPSPLPIDAIDPDTYFEDFWDSYDLEESPPPPTSPNKAFEYCLKTYPYSRKVYVNSPSTLQRAMTYAKPGDMILVADGIYRTNATSTRTFEIRNKKAWAASPITICGSSKAVLDGNRKHAGILVQKSKYVYVVGVSVRNAAKGIKLWTVEKCMLDRVSVVGTNVEAIHIQYHSHYNTVKNCTVRDTGRKIKAVGEGIYLGSSRRNYNGDTCIGNRILYNTIGPGVTAEPIDVKENSKNGIVRGNILDGRDLCGCPDAVSLINVKGNGYLIEGNIGRNAMQDYYKTSKTIPGWGRNNIFKNNKCVTKVRGGFDCTGRPADGNRGNKFY